MPFREHIDQTAQLGLPKGFDLDPDREAPEGSVWGAAFRLENPIVSALSRPSIEQAEPIDRDYNVFDEVQGTRYEQFIDRFAFAQDRADVETLKAQIDREMEDRRVLEAAGWWGTGAEMAAGLLSPTTFLPGGAVYKGAKGGVSIGRTALSVSGWAGAATAVDEIALQASQETRTKAESAVTIGGSMVLGGLLGTFTGKLSQGEFIKLSKATEETMAQMTEFDAAVRSLSAADPAEDLSLRGEKTLQAVRSVPVAGKMLTGSDPLLRTMLHDFPEVRSAVAQLAEPILEYEINKTGKSALGGSVPVETRVKSRRNTELGALMGTLSRSYAAYAMDGPVGKIGTLTAPLTGKWAHLLGYDRKLSISEFSFEVSTALRRGGKHPIPQVHSVAEEIRRTFFHPIFEEAKELGLFPANAKEGENYLTRIYNLPKMVQHMGDGSELDIVPVLEREFIRKRNQAQSRSVTGDIPDWREHEIVASAENGQKLKVKAGSVFENVAARQEKARNLAKCLASGSSLANCARRFGISKEDLAEIKSFVTTAGSEKAGVRAYSNALDAELDELDNALSVSGLSREAASVKDLAEMSDPEIRDAVLDTVNAIRGLKPGARHFEAVLAKPMRARVLDVPDEVIEPWLEKDIRVVLTRYFDTMVPDLELIRQFGDIHMTEVGQKITDAETKRLIRAKSPKERKQIAKAAKDARRDLEAMRDRIRGTYGLPSDPRNGWVIAGRAARTLSYTSRLGGFIFSAMPDLGKVVGQAGEEALFGSITTLSNPKRMGLAVKDASELGAAAEWYLNNRAMEIASITDPFSTQTRVERVIGETGRIFSYANGVIPWNAGWKSVAGAFIASRMSKAAVAVSHGKATKKQLRILAANGIEPWMADRIAKQVLEHGDMEGITWLPQAGRWADPQAFEAFKHSMTREFDLAVPTPGQDKPLTFSSEIGKFVFQFKSFSFSAHHRVLLAGLQKADVDTLATIMPMLAMGALVSNIRADQGRRARKEGAALWEDALDRSGLAGWLFEIHGPANALAGGGLSLSGEELSRFQIKNKFEGLLGPSWGLGTGVAQGISGVALEATGRGSLTSRDVDQLVQAIPGNNLWYLLRVFEKLKEVGEF